MRTCPLPLHSEHVTGSVPGVAPEPLHVSHAMAKLGLNNRVQVALLVHDAGLA